MTSTALTIRKLAGPVEYNLASVFATTTDDVPADMLPPTEAAGRLLTAAVHHAIAKSEGAMAGWVIGQWRSWRGAIAAA
jgi:hypothetical protein